MADKKSLLYEAALELISENPTNPTAIRVSEIAARAGIGKGTVYEYFPTKEELLCGALNYYIGSRLRQIEATIDGSGSFEEKTLAIIEAIISSAKKNKMLLQFFLKSAAAAELKCTQGENGCEYKDSILGIFSRLFAQGMAEGIIRSTITTADGYFASLACAAFLNNIIMDEKLAGVLGISDSGELKRYCYNMLIRMTGEVQR